MCELEFVDSLSSNDCVGSGISAGYIHFELHWIYTVACELYKKHSHLSNQRYRRERPSINNDNLVYQQNVLFASDQSTISLSSSLVFFSAKLSGNRFFSRVLIFAHLLAIAFPIRLEKGSHMCWHCKVIEVHVYGRHHVERHIIFPIQLYGQKSAPLVCKQTNVTQIKVCTGWDVSESACIKLIFPPFSSKVDQS